MILVVIALLIGFCLWVSVVKDQLLWDGLTVGTVAMSLVLAVAAIIGSLLVGFLLALLAGVFMPWQLEEAERVPLVALRDNVGASGTFFLGTGSTDGKLTYFYYEQLPDGGYRASKADSEDAVIYEDDEEAPYVKTYKVDMTARGLDEWWKWVGASTTDRRDFHIPKGSLLRDYRLDLR